MSTKEGYLYDPGTGEELLTTKQAAEYLDYHYDYMRKIASEGKIKFHQLAGKTLLFKKKDLNIYLAKIKDNTDNSREKTENLPENLKAEISIDQGTGHLWEHPYKEINDFKWEQLPLIKAEINSKFGKDLPFTIEIASPDGSSWEIRHNPPTWFEKLFKKGKKE